MGLRPIPHKTSSALHIMLALCPSSRQVVVANEQLDGPDMVGELLGTLILDSRVEETHRSQVGGGKDAQRLKELSARDFLPQFLITEILRLTLQGTDPVHVLISFEQGIEL
jgi:hypothetical protein